jgi:hydroxymethylbilane synthase
VLHRRPDLNLVDMRGNVETRLRKLEEQGLDALVLAQAGLERLNLSDAIAEVLDPEWMLPAVGQGALGLECRSDDAASRGLVERINHDPTRRAVLAERAFLWRLGGGCLVPIGALAVDGEEGFRLRGAVLPPDGHARVSGSVSGSGDEAEALGQRLAEELLARGAGALLAGRAE